MQPSSILCRAQEAHHRDRAAAAGLENVRIIATNAAIAWANEAQLAERREARQSRVRLVADALSAQKQQALEDRDRLFSENPDRGFESV